MAEKASDDKRLLVLGVHPYLVLRRNFNSDETFEAEVQRLLDLGAKEEPYPEATE